MSNTLCMKVEDPVKPIGDETLDESLDPGPPRRAVTGEVAICDVADDDPDADQPETTVPAEPPAGAADLKLDLENADASPPSAASEVRQFIAMLRSERKARTRTRRLKRLGWAVAAAAAAGYLAARSSQEDAPAAAAGPPAALAAVVDRTSLAMEVDLSGRLAPAEATRPLTEAEQCEEHFAQQRWRSAVEVCTRVFEQGPAAGLALRIAHAHYARGQAPPAGFWARTALGLGSKDADAFVLIGHSERQAGHTDKAVDAYERYLQSSPRGWHAKRLRAAIRELRPGPAYRQPSARRSAERTL
jgi:hypothetical protein